MKGSVVKVAMCLMAACLLISAPLVLSTPRLRFNVSNSIPVGIYSETDDDAPYVGFCLPSDVLEQARFAGLQLDHGRCPGDVQPVLKPLYVATPEHPLRLDEHGFVLDGNTLFNTAPKSYSKTGATLQHYPYGVFTSGVWAISTYNPDSFDSRYFGPLDPASIRFRAKPFWTK
jgi:conjugative transfer signal peptidase TraF